MNKQLISFFGSIVLNFVFASNLEDLESPPKNFISHYWVVGNTALGLLELNSLEKTTQLQSGRLTLKNFDTGELVKLTNFSFRKGMCGERFLSFECSRVASNSFWVKSGSKVIKVERPPGFMLNSFFQINKEGDIIKKWNVPFVGVQPVGISEDGQCPYFRYGSNSVVFLSNEDIYFSPISQIPISNFRRVDYSPKKMFSGVGGCFEFLKGDKSFLIWFDWPCFYNSW